MVAGVSVHLATPPETATAAHPTSGAPSSVKATVPPPGAGLTVAV
jgi:hypothetical protein